jgi:hypothetical protein
MLIDNLFLRQISSNQMSSSPSPPASSSSLPCSPYPHLPFELVQQIIRSAVPLRFHSKTYQARQSNLFSFCLVSKTFRQISKPLLFAVARIDEDNRREWLSSIEEEDSTKPPTLELIILTKETGTNLSDATLPIYQNHLQLTKLVIQSEEKNLDIVVLAHLASECRFYISSICRSTLTKLDNFCLLSDLSILHLSGVEVSASRPFTFPRLSQLAIDSVDNTGSFIRNFGPRCFPSLRALSIRETYFDILLSEFSRRLLELYSSQAEVIVIDFEVAEMLSIDLFDRIQHKTLIDTSIKNLRDCESMPFLRLRSNGEFVQSLSSLVFDGGLDDWLTPTLLYLPSQFIEILRFNSIYQDAMQSFLENCADRNIEVIYEEEAIASGGDSEVSQGFWKRMKAESTSERQG